MADKVSEGSRVDTNSLVGRLRRIGTDLAEVEVKSAAGGLPKDIVETLSAFANGGGGTVILGLDERRGFAPAEGFAADRVRDALAGACANAVEPPLRVVITIEEFEDALVVRADIPELAPVDKPCYVRARGHYYGSYIRGGDGDYMLNHYEVSQLLSNRIQPTFDTEPVSKATPDDLDPRLVTALLTRVRRRSPRGIAGLDDIAALQRLQVLVDDKGDLRPTLAGLQCLGAYPQQFFPQLFVSFVVLPGLRMGEQAPDGTRFLDNATLDGPLPFIVADATAVLLRNIRSASVVSGLGREDRYDYPVEVFRELLVNALMHRDYSPESRGTQIQVELYPDRLLVKSPGGLYGASRLPVLGTADQISSSRNAVLARLLSDIELPGEPDRVLCENRGSGLPNVIRRLRQAGMSPPAFNFSPGHGFVTVPQHALLSMDIVDWIASLGQERLTDPHHLALAMMRSAGRVTNAMLQAWGVDRGTAGAALRDLVERELATASGGKRYASYRLSEWVELHAARRSTPDVIGESAGIEADLDAILQAIRAGHVTTGSLQDALAMSERTVLRRIKKLIDRGVVERTRARNDRRQSYRPTGKEQT